MRPFGSMAALAAAAIALPAAGATVTFVGPFSAQGTGFGNVLNVLSLQGSPNESGSVLWNGSADALTGDATNQSRTRTVTELASSGINAAAPLGVVFNINEPGATSDLTLQGFTVRFLSPSGGTLFDAVQTGNQTLTPVNQGTGGAGYLYNITLTPSEASSFFSNPANRIGLVVNSTSPILNSAGGPENFYLVPAPGAGVLALAGAVMFRRRRGR